MVSFGHCQNGIREKILLRTLTGLSIFNFVKLLNTLFLLGMLSVIQRLRHSCDASQ